MSEKWFMTCCALSRWCHLFVYFTKCYCQVSWSTWYFCLPPLFSHIKFIVNTNILKANSLYVEKKHLHALDSKDVNQGDCDHVEG